jgi:hypothetical protein
MSQNSVREHQREPISYEAHAVLLLTAARQLLGVSELETLLARDPHVLVPDVVARSCVERHLADGLLRSHGTDDDGKALFKLTAAGLKVLQRCTWIVIRSRWSAIHGSESYELSTRTVFHTYEAAAKYAERHRGLIVQGRFLELCPYESQGGWPGEALSAHDPDGT